MSLTLHFHPLASYCHKALIALYENDTPFTPKLVNLSSETERAALLKLWPIGKFPVLRDEARDQTIPESSIIIEYLDRHYPGAVSFIPGDVDLAWRTRLRDRFYDLYVHEPMQKIVVDRLRPAEKRDAHGVEEAKARLLTFLRHDRPRDGGGDLGHGRRVQPRRLRRGAGVVLCQRGGAVRHAQARRGLFRSAAGAVVLCPRVEGG